MLKTERDIYAARSGIDGFNKVAGLGDDTLLDQEVIGEFLEDHTRRMTAAVLLSSASRNLPAEEREGIVYFTTLFLHSDDVVDSGAVVPSNPDEFRKHILDAPVADIETDLIGWDLYDLTMQCFPVEKRETIDNYLQRMSELHAQGRHVAVVGGYGFPEARAYKEETNLDTFRTGLELVETRIPPKRLMPIFMAGQYVDDLEDWQKDQATYNLFIGKACDVWQAKGEPEWQDVDFLFKTEGQYPAIEVIKEPNMQDTRRAYRAAFLDEFKGQRDSSLSLILKASGMLLF